MVCTAAMDGIGRQRRRSCRRLKLDHHAQPRGEDYPGNGVYLEIVPNERLVFTDAFTSAWVPSAKPFMVVTIQLDELDSGKTRYTATVLHWSAEDREAHEKMGFHQGWGQCAEQLAALAAKI